MMEHKTTGNTSIGGGLRSSNHNDNNSIHRQHTSQQQQQQQHRHPSSSVARTTMFSNRATAAQTLLVHHVGAAKRRKSTELLGDGKYLTPISSSSSPPRSKIVTPSSSSSSSSPSSPPSYATPTRTSTTRSRLAFKNFERSRSASSSLSSSLVEAAKGNPSDSHARIHNNNKRAALSAPAMQEEQEVVEITGIGSYEEPISVETRAGHSSHPRPHKDPSSISAAEMASGVSLVRAPLHDRNNQMVVSQDMRTPLREERSPTLTSLPSRTTVSRGTTGMPLEGSLNSIMNVNAARDGVAEQQAELGKQTSKTEMLREKLRALKEKRLAIQGRLQALQQAGKESTISKAASTNGETGTSIRQKIEERRRKALEVRARLRTIKASLSCTTDAAARGGGMVSGQERGHAAAIPQSV